MIYLVLKQILSSPQVNRTQTIEDQFIFPLPSNNTDKDNSHNEINKKFSLLNKIEEISVPDFLRESNIDRSSIGKIKNIGEEKRKFEEINNITNYEKKFDLPILISKKISNNQMSIFGDDLNLSYNTNLSNINIKNNESLFSQNNNDFNDFSVSFFSNENK